MESVLLLSFSQDAWSNVVFSQGIYDHVTVDVGYPKISQVTSAVSPGFIVTSDIFTCGFSVNSKFIRNNKSILFSIPFTSNEEHEFLFSLHSFIICIKSVGAGIVDRWVSNF